VGPGSITNETTRLAALPTASVLLIVTVCAPTASGALGVTGEAQGAAGEPSNAQVGDPPG
jgi:hypothetical protein